MTDRGSREAEQLRDYEPVSDFFTFCLFTGGFVVLCFAVAGVVALIRSMFAA